MRRLLAPLAAALIALALGLGAVVSGHALRPAPTAAACVSANFSRDCATGAEYPYRVASPQVVAPALP